MSTRADVVAVARSYIDTPWHHMGRQPGIGLDCAGVLICCARELALVEPDFDVHEYTTNPDGSLLATCDRFMTRIARAAMAPGDVVVLTTDEDPQHLGIVGDYRHGGLSIIHANNTSRPAKVMEHRLMFSRAHRFVAAYALPGMPT